MIIDDFKQKVVSQYWVKGGVWEFDWYLDVFFCEVMSYGDMPMHIGYEQAILGDNFLNPINWDESLKPFAGFFGNSDHVEDLIQKQNTILQSAGKFMHKMKKGVFYAHEYAQIQKNLSLLMASVSVVLDKLISTELKRIAADENIGETRLLNYVVKKSSRTKLNENNLELIKLYQAFRNDIDQANFNFENITNEKIKLKLTNHTELYGWINTGEKGGREWQPDDFLFQMKALGERRDPDRTDEVLMLKGENKYFLELMVDINLNDNWAADRQVELDYLFQKHLKRELEDFYIDRVVENLTYEEIVEALTRPNLMSSLYKARENNWRAAWPEKGKLHFYYFQNKKDFDDVVDLVANKPASSSLIVGSVACKGRVEGRVRIVETQADLEKFQKGEILVAVKTQPKYVMAMTKAIAIVTDIGGITSHAAIISREFGIPCIVGTGNATKILKNGDMVVVDAEEGKVIKL